MTLRWFHSPGWYGLRTGSLYWVVRDVRRHPLRYGERHGSGRRLAGNGGWEMWLR